MGVTLDKPTQRDEVFQRNGFDLIIDKQVLNLISGVQIQYLPNRWIGSELRVTPI